MKKRNQLVVLLGIFSMMPLFASDHTPPKIVPPPPSVDVGVFTKEPLPPHRPKAPSAQYISCVYSDGYVSINFAIPEGLVEMTLTDALGSCSYYEFDSSAPADIFVGYHNEAYIELTTAKGYSYEGCWCLD